MYDHLLTVALATRCCSWPWTTSSTSPPSRTSPRGSSTLARGRASGPCTPPRGSLLSYLKIANPPSDFADQFPSAEVIGTDLSPIQPAWVPPNCKFELDDAQLPWTFPDNHFDFIHMRLMMGSIKDWPFLYSEVLRCLKPGGWFEHMDYDPHVYSDDGSLAPDSAWHAYGDLFITAGEKLGRTFNIIIDQANMGWMRDAGFVNVNERRLKLPMGGWAADPKLKDVGRYNLLSTEQGLEGFMLYILTNVHGWDVVQAHAYVASVRSELKKRSNHAYYFA